MARKGDKVVFAVGEASGRHSSVWRIWPQKSKSAPRSDIYVTAIPLGGALKVSLHQSGSWSISFTQEFEAKSLAEGAWLNRSRHLDIFPRPGELAPGVTLALRIWIPESELRKTPVEPTHKSLVWVPAAPQGHVTDIQIFITAPSATVSNWPGKNSMKTELVGKFKTTDDDTVWVVHRSDPASSDFVAELARVKAVDRSGAKRLDSSEPIDPDTPNLRAIAPTDDSTGNKVLVELAMSNDAA
jgi:hypothetical protein